jgi:hypothetical protein
MPLRILGFITAALAGGIPLIIVAMSDSYRQEVIAGCGVGALLMLVVFFGLKWSFEKSFNLFLGVLVGGILFRLIALMGTGWLVHRLLDWSLAAYMFATLYYLFVFQTLELIHFHYLRKGRQVDVE